MLQQLEVGASLIRRAQVGKSLSFAGLPLGGSAGAVATAQQVRRDDGVAGGIQCFSGADQRAPPRLHVRAPGKCMEDQDPTIFPRSFDIAQYAVSKAQPADRLTRGGR